MVSVFREVRRVLRDDGVCWLNLGDSYNANTGAGFNAHEKTRPHLSGEGIGQKRIDEANRNTRMPRPPGLKPKDLCGIPWGVAKALQKPYYTGSIRDERDRIWLAAMLDAEGCLFIHKRKAGQHNGQGYFRKKNNFGPGIEIANTSLAVVERIAALVGKGSICSQGPEETGGRRKQTIYRWNLRTTESRDFVRELYPYLVAKRRQARILYGCPSSGERAEAAHAALKALHRGGETDVDFPEIPSLFEQGFYLRSEIIWSKLNPMPESTRDRPTKAHEQIFLLTKAERYFYDQEAVREPVNGNAHARKKSDGSTDGVEIKAKAIGKRDSNRTTPRQNASYAAAVADLVSERNLRTVWTIPTQPYPGAHFATFPEELAERCVKAGTSEKGACSQCGTPWRRVVERKDYGSFHAHGADLEAGQSQPSPGKMNGNRYMREYEPPKTIDWQPGCCCGAAVVPCVVLDPFFGSGTVGRVCRHLRRNCLGIELNPDYAEQARQRVSAPLDRNGADRQPESIPGQKMMF